MYYSGYGYNTYNLQFALSIIGIVLAIAATVLLLIFVVPEKKREKLPTFFKAIHDICNFKGLLLEKVLKVLYIFSTLNVIFGGFLNWFKGGNFGLNFLVGLAMMVLGPIVLRLVYEALMLFVLLVKNVIQINNKLKNNNNAPQNDPFNNDFDGFERIKSAGFGVFNNANSQSPYAEQNVADAGNANQSAYVGEPQPEAQEPAAPVQQTPAYNNETTVLQQPDNAFPAQDENVRFCTSCGTKLVGNIIRCPKCGKYID